MLYKLPKQKQAMPDDEQIIIAVMAMVGLPTLVAFVFSIIF